jgi:hypothetical protein
MTTGATGQLGLALPVQGELSGTWGDTVNNGITQYTNIAIAATLTLTNDGAVTLANTTGDATASNIVSSLTGAGTVTAQFAIVRVTGTLTTAKVVTAPSYSKTYTVVNAATGGIVTFKASGQTGVSIAVGESAFVYFNGTDYVKLAGTVDTGVTSFTAGTTGLTPATATTGAVTLAGTLATTNGGTGLTSFTSGGVVYASSSSALATGSAFTFDGTTPTSSNATGAPNFIFNSNANTPYIRFDQTGASKFTIGESSIVGGGGAGFYDFYAVASVGQRFFTNAAERMRITSAGDVGIGQTSPSVPLDVNRSSATSGLMLNLQNTSTGSFIQFAQPGVANLLFGCPNADAFVWKTFAGGTYPERMRLQAGLGVGTTSDPGAGAIYATGNITAFFSDKRLKTVSGKIENALDKVGKLSGVYYTFNDTAKSFGYDSDEEQVGVIAQEVEAVLPQIVKPAPFDLDENNNSKSGENYKTVQYDKLVPLLIEAINELQAKVKALEAK